MASPVSSTPHVDPAVTVVSAPTAAAVENVPPLENGDRLSRVEFERRYQAMPEVKKAELIEGLVYVGSPVSNSHASSHAYLIAWAVSYVAHTPHLSASDNGTVRLDLDNEPQPDIALRIDAARGGQSKLSPDDYVEGPPELIAEIATTSASYDLHAKAHVYRRNGVQEYIVWRTFDAQLDWFVLVDGQYQALELAASGFLESRVFPGLWLDRAALLRGDPAAVLAALDQGLKSAAHAEFVSRLQPPPAA